MLEDLEKTSVSSGVFHEDVPGKPDHEGGTLVDISVVICTYNRRNALTSALQSVIRQETADGFTFEIVIIDDGSIDGTEDSVREMAQCVATPSIRCVHTEGDGIAAARNRGVKESFGNWVAFFDDDQWAEPQWLAELYRVAQEGAVDCVAGTRLLGLPESANVRLGPFCRGLLGESILGQNLGRCEGTPEVFNTGNVLIRRQLFERVGGFDGSTLAGGIGAEDCEFFWRAAKHGAIMSYAPMAIVRHIIPDCRLRGEYFKRTSLRLSLGSTSIRYKHKGRLRWLLGLGKRICAALGRDGWLLLAALLLRDNGRALERRCRLWYAIGYVRGSISLLAPGALSQRQFIEGVSFRERTEEFSKNSSPWGV
jgi:glycosyltransferase involved in cell wall biosynthesis